MFTLFACLLYTSNPSTPHDIPQTTAHLHTAHTPPQIMQAQFHARDLHAHTHTHTRKHAQTDIGADTHANKRTSTPTYTHATGAQYTCMTTLDTHTNTQCNHRGSRCALATPSRAVPLRKCSWCKSIRQNELHKTMLNG